MRQYEVPLDLYTYKRKAAKYRGVWLNNYAISNAIRPY